MVNVAVQRILHQEMVQQFLQSHIRRGDWRFTLPPGSGNETYFAHSGDQSVFVKVGAQVERYGLMAEAGLSPPVVTAGTLPEGASVLVQPLIAGHQPNCRDFQQGWKRFAETLGAVHHLAALRAVLPYPRSDDYRTAGRAALQRLRGRWEVYQAAVPSIAQEIDAALDKIAEGVEDFQGSGLVVSHNDICNANWLVGDDGRLYLLDLDMLSIDDPAQDAGALLWWYYPPHMRSDFLQVGGYENNAEFQRRMQLRMAMHSLSILLPREGSFDGWNPARFEASLGDFWAVLAGKQNPQGYV